MPDPLGLPRWVRGLACPPSVIHPRYLLKGAAALLALLISAFAGPRGVVAGEDDPALTGAHAAVARALAPVTLIAIAEVVARPIAIAFTTVTTVTAAPAPNDPAVRPCGAGGGPRAPC